MTILGAMSLRGIIASMTIEEATDGDIFLAYVGPPQEKEIYVR